MEATKARIINIRVTNYNETSYTDFHNGERYVFEGGGKTTSIPLEAATHIFGYSMKDSDEASMFNHVCKRWGWNTPENVKENFKGPKSFWAKITFTPVAVKYTEVPVIDTASLAEDRESAARAEDAAFAIPDLKLGEKTIAA